MKIETKFAPKDRVIIDGCKDLICVITAVQWRNSVQICYEVSWICQGKSETVILEEWRLTLA